MGLFGGKKPETPTMGEMTVLHSDVRGFTIIGERLTGDEIFALLNDYLCAMHKVILDHGGELVCPCGSGDSTTAVFSGADHARRGGQTATGMMTALGALHKKWDAEGLPALDIGIGLNSGSMALGNLGLYPKPFRFVLGDNVNLGVRLCDINRNYGSSIVLAEPTHAPIATECTARELDIIRVKGRKQAARIFELWSMTPPTPEMATRRLHWDKGLSAYRTQRWDAAAAAFSQLGDDFAASMYLQRCEIYKANPPGDGWDGVYTMTTR